MKNLLAVFVLTLVLPGWASTWHVPAHPRAPWDQADTAVLDEWLLHTGTLDLAKVEPLLRSYFGSDGISPQVRPYEWLPTLEKYCSGPLNTQGLAKSSIACSDAKFARQIAQVEAEQVARKAADQAADVNARLGRAAGLVVVRLAQMGYRVVGDSTPGLPAHCMLLAVPRLARGRKVMAARICVSVAGIGEGANGEDVYLATLREIKMPNTAEILAQVVFEPPLKG